MPAAKDFTFEPKVWQGHIEAYFRRKLAYGAFAFTPDDERPMSQNPGDTIHFPYYKKIGDAEEPAAEESLQVEPLLDDSFTATLKEVGKAVGIRDAAYRKSADKKEKISQEAQRQLGRVIAEKVDKDLILEIATASKNSFTATAAAEVAKIKNILQAKILGFGDLHMEAAVIFMHSLQYYDMIADDTTGFLKADANDPFKGIQGFQGRILDGMAVVTVDSIPEVSGGIDGKRAFDAYICKPNAYGYILGEDMELETDRDILAREDVMAMTHWYAVKNFHNKVASDDDRIIRMRTTTSFATA